jgi:hypothetical protein
VSPAVHPNRLPIVVEATAGSHGAANMRSKKKKKKKKKAKPQSDHRGKSVQGPEYFLVAVIMPEAVQSAKAAPLIKPTRQASD